MSFTLHMVVKDGHNLARKRFGEVPRNKRDSRSRGAKVVLPQGVNLFGLGTELLHGPSRLTPRGRN